MTRWPAPHRTPLHRPWVVWLAVWLALFAALAPTVSYAFHAAASRDSAELHAVCSSALVETIPSVAPSAPVWLRGESPQPDD
jgi:hypothetical protein